MPDGIEGKEVMADLDSLLERIASEIQNDNFLDYRGVMAKGKRAQEAAIARMNTRREQATEIADFVRSFKGDAGNSLKSMLANCVAQQKRLGFQVWNHETWQLAAAGLVSVELIIDPMTNQMGGEYKCRITLTDAGRTLLSAAPSEISAAPEK